MLKKATLAAAGLMTVMTAIPAAADARPRDRGHGYYSQNSRDGYYRDRYDRRSYRNNDRCRSGTTGAIVGGAAGALLGREVAGRGDRTLGTILGGAAGLLGGRALTRDKHCR
ncbi:glycine zipper 2TM domain-containing protein [Sphingosinicella sp. BN140058]|uniref:glycine zipper 2TM domain-containing protein n=1 Tax=Sphingosinicella sp. BN140058 TaxID=1892855 RepID=UPI00101056F9|nr:glycine zipper 2TM domain-containing protein [Sphingosinicella sp. BN140058]QAY75501.1 glycine zipper 2TM domain-containing protein [Sphingosinicella sp. BN140058]